MRFFYTIALVTVLLLGLASQTGLLKKTPPHRKVPDFLVRYKRVVAASFERRENAHIIFAMITGNKNGISPYTKKAFKKTNLSFLLSPSGIHLGGALLFMKFLLRRIRSKWIREFLKSGLLLSIVGSSSFETIRRLSGLRILLQLKFLAKLKVSTEALFFILFLLSFLMGDFHHSPLGFIYSFAFLGAFYSLRAYSKIILILGLFTLQLILGLFLGESVSFLAVGIGLLGSYCFSFLFPIIVIFLATFWIIEINWIEPLIRALVVCVQTFAKILNGSFTSASVFLIMAVLILVMPKNFKGKHALFGMLFFLHTDTGMTPSIFTSI